MRGAPFAAVAVKSSARSTTKKADETGERQKHQTPNTYRYRSSAAHPGGKGGNISVLSVKCGQFSAHGNSSLSPSLSLLGTKSLLINPSLRVHTRFEEHTFACMLFGSLRDGEGGINYAALLLAYGRTVAPGARRRNWYII